MYESRLNSVRVYLVREGLITQPQVGYWQLTEKGWNTTEVHIESLPARRRKRRKKSVQAQENALAQEKLISLDELLESAAQWENELQDIFYQWPPDAFERFFARLFRSEGIDKVEVINTSGADEIEGMMSSSGFLTFRIAFKFIRGDKLISAREVDDFRRSIRASRAHKGLLITTGNFTSEALRDATREYAPEVELYDKKKFIDKLKELGIGIRSEIVRVERVVIDTQWFRDV